MSAVEILSLANALLDSLGVKPIITAAFIALIAMSVIGRLFGNKD